MIEKNKKIKLNCEKKTSKGKIFAVSGEQNPPEYFGKLKKI